MIDILLSEISAIHKKYALIYEKTGADFNILKIIGKDTDEVITCKLLCELLDPHGDHHQGDAYLKLFVENVLRINFNEQDYTSAWVSGEYSIEGRRSIDLLIETKNHKIPIEVKIHAPDQTRQCYDYYQSAQNSNLYYLTLDGKPPSEESAKGLTLKDDESGEYQEVTQISFRDDIIGWLDSCLALPGTIKIAPIREILLQFKDVLMKLTGQMEEDAEMEIVKKITSSAENMQSAIDIANVLPDAKAEVLLGLFRELKRLFENADRTIWDYDEDVIGQYYAPRKQSHPYLGIKINKLPHNLIATLCVEVDSCLYFGFAFTEMDKRGEYCEYKEKESVKKKYPDIYEGFASAVFDVMKITEEQSDEENEIFLFSDYLYDDKCELFDFKTFSSPCVDLVGSYKEQAKRIFDMLNDYVEAINKGILFTT
jgi:hypothetical protein